MDKTLGAYSILACRKTMDEAGVTRDQIERVICCDSHIAGGTAAPHLSGRHGPTSPRPTIPNGAHSGQRAVADRADAPAQCRVCSDRSAYHQ